MAVSVTGVFPDLVDERCFFDRIVVGVWGKRKKDITGIAGMRNIAIGGGRRPYSRAVVGRCDLSGNEVQFRYGRFLRTPWADQLPAQQIAIKSDRVPITCAELMSVAESFVTARNRQVVSTVELTFDTHLPFDIVSRDLFTTAKAGRELCGQDGRTTLYVGSPRSDWQARIYEKTSDVLRVEFVLRRGFLRSMAITRPHHLLHLRNADIWKQIWWQDFIAPMTALARISGRVSDWRLDAYAHLLDKSVQEFSKMIRRDFGIIASPFLGRSTVFSTLNRMQRHLLW